MRALLRRAWHSPRSGPVLLVVFGLPVLVLGIVILAFPAVVAVELARGAVVAGHQPFARTSSWYVASASILWAVLIVVLLRARQVARQNRGLDVSIEVVAQGPHAGGTVGLARRLGMALAAPGIEVSRPVREDYGAGCWVTVGPDRFWLSVAAAGKGLLMVGLTYDPGLDLRLRLARRADRAAFRKLEAALRAAIGADGGLRSSPDARD